MDWRLRPHQYMKTCRTRFEDACHAKVEYIPVFEEVEELINRIESFEISEGKKYSQFINWGYPNAKGKVKKLREYKDILLKIQNQVFEIESRNKVKCLFDYKKIETMVNKIIGTEKSIIDIGRSITDLDEFIFNNPLYSSFHYWELIYYKFNPDVEITVTPVNVCVPRVEFELKKLPANVCNVVFEVKKEIECSKNFDFISKVENKKECTIEYNAIKLNDQCKNFSFTTYSVLKGCNVSYSSIVEVAKCRGIEFKVDHKSNSCELMIGSQKIYKCFING